MVSYKRPDFPVVTFRDTSGAIIEYGRRWQDQQAAKRNTLSSWHLVASDKMHETA